MRHGIALTLLAATCTVAFGCAAPTEGDESEADTTTAAVTRANDEFASVLKDAEQLEARCHAEGHCEGNVTGSGLTPSAVAVDLGGVKPAGRKASSFSMCEALEPFRALGHPFFFAGVSAKAAYVVTLKDGGIDIVFDLQKKQAALFHYHNVGVQNLIGVEVNAYMGYAFGDKAGVLDAWSGEFQSAEASFEVPVLKLGVGGNIFRSPDNSLWGGALSVSAGLNAIAAPVSAGVSEGHWTAWDKATSWYGDRLWLVRYDEKLGESHGKSHKYIQFRGTRDIVLALLQSFGVIGAAPAAQAAALAALDKVGLTIDRACPKAKSGASHAPTH